MTTTMKNTKTQCHLSEALNHETSPEWRRSFVFLPDDSFPAGSLDVNAGLELKQQAGFHIAESFVFRNNICTGQSFSHFVFKYAVFIITEFKGDFFQNQ